jgi:hypothetical protein
VGPLQGLGDGNRPEPGGGHVGQLAEELADRRADGGEQECVRGAEFPSGRIVGDGTSARGEELPPLTIAAAELTAFYLILRPPVSYGGVCPRESDPAGPTRPSEPLVELNARALAHTPPDHSRLLDLPAPDGRHRSVPGGD